MKAGLIGKPFALACTAAFIVCSAGFAGEADSGSIAKPDYTSSGERFQIECEKRKRTAESWPVVNRSRIDQEVDRNNMANGGQNNRLDPPRFITGNKEAAEGRSMTRALTQVCTMNAVDAVNPKAKVAKKPPANKRAGPR